MGKLIRRLIDGDTTVAEWSPEDPASVQAAQAVLRDEIQAGYHAVRDDGGSKEPVTDLPPDAERVILTMPMGGG